jgi:hypothetical protein
MARALLLAHLKGQDAGPPASLYLAVRAARRALAAKPEDARIHLVLGEVYSRLSGSTRERVVVQNVFGEAAALRQAQTGYAFNRALGRGNGPVAIQVAHLGLARLYSQPLYFELRVEHARKYLDLGKKRGLIGVPKVRMDETLRALEKEVEALERELTNRRDRYEVASAGKPVLERAGVALRHGLAKTAINLLREAEKDGKGGREGLALLTDLLLATGRPEEVKAAWITEDEWRQVVLAATRGDYAKADRALEALLARQRKHIRAALAGLALGPPPPNLPARVFARLHRFEVIRRLQGLLDHEADLHALRGWLALEAGNEAQAREHLGLSLAGGPGARSRALAVNCLRLLGPEGAKKK